MSSSPNYSQAKMSAVHSKNMSEGDGRSFDYTPDVFGDHKNSENSGLGNYQSSPINQVPTRSHTRDTARDLDARSTDTSMEEILASLRKIIADDFHVETAQTMPSMSSYDEPTEDIFTAPQSKEEFVKDERDTNAAYNAMRREQEARLRQNHQARMQERGYERSQEKFNEKLKEKGQERIQERSHPPSLSKQHYDQDTDQSHGLYEVDEMGGNGHAQGALLSSTTNAAVSSSFEALSSSLAMQKNLSIETLAREMLRPMLKSWLDEHLPAMVERLVRNEIERVARSNRE